MSTDTALTLDLRLGNGRQLCYLLQFWCILLQIHLLAVALSAVQLHTLVDHLCIPNTSQSLEREKGSLGTKSCLPLRPEIQITRGAESPGVPRGWERLGAPQGGRTGQDLTARAGPCSQGLSHRPSQGAGQAGGHQGQPQPQVSVSPWDWLWGAGSRPCCGVAGAGMDGPGGTEIVSWALGQAGGSPEEAAQDHHYRPLQPSAPSHSATRNRQPQQSWWKHSAENLVSEAVDKKSRYTAFGPCKL